MRIIIVNGSPRAGGHTSDLIDLFAAGAAAAGGDIRVIHLRQAKIASCTGCYRCWIGDHAGRCIHSDDMEGIIEDYLRSDALVLATPLYFYGFSALIKRFVERLLPLTRPGLDTGGATGLGRNRPRYPDAPLKRCVLIASCGLSNPEIMTPLVNTFQLMCDALSATPAGTLLRPQSTLMDFGVAKPKIVRRVTRAVERAGAELVRDGAVSAETEQEVMTPIIPDDEIFQRHLETYWTIASELNLPFADRKTLMTAATKDPRILVSEMAHLLDPKAAESLEAVIQLVFRDSPHGQWQLIICDGKCHAVQGAHPSPDLTLTMSEQTFSDIALQRTDTRIAFRKGAIEAEGSNRLLAGFSRLFRNPDR